MHGDQGRHAAALLVRRAHQVPGLSARHDHVQIGARLDLAEVHVEAMGEGQHGALFDIRFDLIFVDGGLHFVRHQDHHHIRFLHRGADFFHRQAGLLGLVPGAAALAQADCDFHAGILQVERMRMALRAVADDGDFFLLDDG